MEALGKFFSFSFLWGFFQWFFTGGTDCGFVAFPTFGLKAYDNKYELESSISFLTLGSINVLISDKYSLTFCANLSSTYN